MRVLVTGATGYIGSRLIPSLLAEGHEVVAATRGLDLDDYGWGDQVEHVRLDVGEESSVVAATKGIDAVVYLVHSLEERDFISRDRAAALRMATACKRNGVSRIVYLSGIVPAEKKLSAHLRSRLEVEEVLTASGVPTTSLRAAMVIGSGSTSFEVLRRITERVRLTPVPTWMWSTTLQPIAVQDVVEVIVAALRGEPQNRPYDIGGPETPTYPELLGIFARVAGLRRLRVPIPLLPVTLVGTAVAAIAQMPRSMVVSLVASLASDMTCGDDDVLELLGGQHDFLPIRDAIVRSLAEADDGTGLEGDVQVAADTDPGWAGGFVSIRQGHPVIRPANRLAALLLGFAPRSEPETA